MSLNQVAGRRGDWLAAPGRGPGGGPGQAGRSQPPRLGPAWLGQVGVVDAPGLALPPETCPRVEAGVVY